MNKQPGRVRVTSDWLKGWPLPKADADADKEDRGPVLVVGGSSSVPGAVLLAGVAALRVGAGKLKLATVGSVAHALAVAVPEALVLSLDEEADGTIDGEAAGKTLSDQASRTKAVLVGAGMSDPDAARQIIASLVTVEVDAEADGPILILDAAAITCLATGAGELLAPVRHRVILTPNAVEAAALASCALEDVEGDPVATATALARDLGVVVALKGATTYTCGPSGEVFADEAGNPGLGTSGSGDVAAGAVAGLAARGADPLQAAVWGMHVHAAAGDRLAERVGPIGYLARELLDELPGVLAGLG